MKVSELIRFLGEAIRTAQLSSNAEIEMPDGLPIYAVIQDRDTLVITDVDPDEDEDCGG